MKKTLHLGKPACSTAVASAVLTVYASPQYHMRFAINGGDSIAQYLASSLGAKIGDKVGVFVEGSYGLALTEDTGGDEFQFNVSGFMTF